jgi:uncharacterized protein YcbK (DUF882 family)
MEDSRRGMRYEDRDMSYVVRFGLISAALGAVVLGFPGGAGADVTHTVARGHTLDAIAHRYHVTTKAIVEANHLKDPKHLKVGDTLTIPGVTAQDKATGAKGKTAAGKPVKVPTYAAKAKTPGVVHVTRLATSEDFTVRVSDRRGKASPVALKSFEKLMRSGGGSTHPIDPRLVALVAIVSNHFGSRKLEVVSGFRPYTPTQHTAHSNHNVGRAIDFRVAGVPNEVLRDFCRTLKNVGVGYYPNSTFVHMDVREAPAFWIDYSKPGEAPRYNSPGVDADEGTSDVAEESHLPDPGMAAPMAPGTAADPSAVPSATATPTPTASPSPTPTPTPTPTVLPTPAPVAPPSIPAPKPSDIQ